MAEAWLAALSRAVREKLTANPEPWHDRVYKDIAPQLQSGKSLPKPYVVQTLVAGGNAGMSKRDFVNVRWQVKAIANTQESAFDCFERISALLNNADRETVRELDGGDDWYVLSTKQEDAIDLTELVDGNRIYYAGAVFRILMETKVSVI